MITGDTLRQTGVMYGPTITAEEAYWIPQHISTLSSVCVTTGGEDAAQQTLPRSEFISSRSAH